MQSILNWSRKPEESYLVDPSIQLPTNREHDLEILRNEDNIEFEKTILDEIDEELRNELGSDDDEDDEDEGEDEQSEEKPRKRKYESESELDVASGTLSDSQSWQDFEESLENELAGLNDSD